MTRKWAIIGFVAFGAVFASMLQMQWDVRQMRGQLNILHGDLVQARSAMTDRYHALTVTLEKDQRDCIARL